jgi:hypothetical protein
MLTIPQGRFVWGYGNDDLHGTAITATSGLHVNYNRFIMPETTVDNLEVNLRNAMANGHSYIVTVAAGNEGVNVAAGTPSAQRPFIKSITTGDNTITIEAGNATSIMWLSEGRPFHRSNSATSTLNLLDPDIVDDVGVFVRANIIGPGGMAVIQPIGTKRN